MSFQKSAVTSPLNPTSGGIAVPLDAQDEPIRASSLYRAVWRWHFYAGLICLPFLVLMAVTGGLYLFKNEINGVVYRDLLQVVPGTAPALLPDAIVARAVAAVPGKASRYLPPSNPESSAEVGIATADGQQLSVYVDPSSGQVLGQLVDSAKLMQVVRKLHSLAIAGTIANYWIEIVAGWTIVLVVTGTYLWWPRGRSGGVVTVRSQPAKRLWWRDLHAVTGAFAGVVILFLAVTGMPWSAFWGQQFGHITNAAGVGLPEYLWDKVPQSDVTLAQRGEVAWTLRDSAVPTSEAAGHPIGLNAAVAAFDKLAMRPGYSIALPADASGVYTASLFPADATQERVIHLDQYRGKTLVDVGYADYGFAGKATEWGISVHTGQQFGLLNQLVMLAGCLAILALAVSSFVMWWKRRPDRKLGAPVRKDGHRLARTTVAIAIVLGLLYPLVGASMLVALALDTLLPRLWRGRYGL
ncbi:PepSY-associated TM helix domain-containing protein [Rhodoferax sp.]|uniref:PepSY-associated TM helix domain-containing protein n=1 Tax=Rhodoferax sp. TaxID=50421 RepID=UPI00374DCBAD